MEEACGFVNLKYAELTHKYPFELSGGQMQRLMIARIFLLKPKILVADEPTSMIDACSRATILDYLMKLRDETGMTLIFITHDIGLGLLCFRHGLHHGAGSICRAWLCGQCDFAAAQPYTRRLISDVPKIHEPWDLSTVVFA
jgi:peptide/nickel transport system ATP-binding protein